MARLSLFLLGGFEARLDEIPITGFKTDKTRALLAYLAVEHERPHRRQTLAGLLWPGYLESSARANLRHALANLRQVLADEAADPPCLLVEGETIQLNPAAEVWVDVGEFEQGVRDKGQGIRIDGMQSSIPNQQSSIANLQSAVSPYRGAFLEGFSLPDSPEFDNWVLAEREGLQRHALSALYQLAERYEQQGNLEEASQFAQRQLELEPWREDAHRQLMRLLALSGQRAAALAQYQACRRALADELQVQPSTETERLYEAIRDEDMERIKRKGIGDMGAGEKSLSPIPYPLSPAQPQPKHNLPAPLTRLIGRENEVSQVKQLLETHRLVTLTGAGGVGKTRLSIQVGEELVELFEDGIWFVDLAPISDPKQAPSEVARTLGAREEASRSVIDTLTISIRSRKLLIVLDNCEHLLKACAGLVEVLLRLCPALKVMVTSREPLGVMGELVYRVPSLSYPQVGPTLSSKDLQEYPAIGLLIDRVRLLLPDYQVTKVNALALMRISQQLNGIPLALELAAARFSMLAAEQVANRLEDAFRLLTSGSRTALLRHQTLRATMDWSYNLLEARERLLLQRLTVFAGGFTLEAAEAVCGGEGLEKPAVLDLLTALVDKSMVIAHRQQGEETRYRLLETVRQYAREKLLAAGESEWLNNRHCDYYLWLAEQAEPRLKTAERLNWNRRLTLEYHNTHQALEWSFSHGNPQSGLRIIVALERRFWLINRYQNYGAKWVEKGSAFARKDANIPPMILLRLLNSHYSHEYVSQQSDDEVINLCRQIGSPADAELSYFLSIKGYHIMSSMGLEDALRKYIQQCMEVIPRLKPTDIWDIGWAYGFLAWVYSTLEEYPTARQYALESWRCFQQSGDRWFVTHLIILGGVAEHEGDYDRARQCYLDSLAIHKEVDDVNGMFVSLISLLSLELSQGNTERAVFYSRDLLKIYIDAYQDRIFVPLCNLGASEVMHCQALPLAERERFLTRAARLFGAAEAMGLQADSANRIWIQFYPPALELLRSQLDADALATTWAEGAAMSMEEAYQYALEEGGG